MTTPYRCVDGAWEVRVYVQPGARATSVGGSHDGCLKVRVAAPPSEGRANAALVAALAAALDVPARAVRLTRGAGSRRKAVRVSATGSLGARLARLCQQMP